MQLKENLRGILHSLALLGAGVLLGFCVIWWLQTPPAKARHLRPLIKEIDDYKAAHGKYPASCEQFASFASLTNQFTIYTGSTNYGGYRFWDLWEIKQHDFSVLMDFDDGERDVCQIFMPVADAQQMHAYSLKYMAWRYDFKSGHWRKGRISFSSHGPYWKPGFLR